MGNRSIRWMMLVIAGVAVLLGGYIGWERMYPARDGNGRRSPCASNLRNIVLAIHGYTNEKGHLPAGTWPNASLPTESRLSWYAAIQPYLDNPEFWDSLHKDRPSNDDSNERIANISIGTLQCSQRVRPPVEVPMPTPYIGIAGLGNDAPSLPKGHPRAGIFGYDRLTTPADITDGTAYTLVVAESGRIIGSWLSGGPATVRGLDTTDQPYIGPGRQFGGLHQHSGVMAAFADGSVRFLSDAVDPRIFEALSTIAGGERLPDDLFR